MVCWAWGVVFSVLFCSARQRKAPWQQAAVGAVGKSGSKPWDRRQRRQRESGKKGRAIGGDPESRRTQKTKG